MNTECYNRVAVQVRCKDHNCIRWWWQKTSESRQH